MRKKEKKYKITGHFTTDEDEITRVNTQKKRKVSRTVSSEGIVIINSFQSDLLNII
jgi:hypothetical protein